MSSAPTSAWGLIGDGALRKPYIVLEDEKGGGPLVALVFTLDEESAQFVATSDATGRVDLLGFERRTDQSAVRGQLILKNLTRDVYLIDPYLGNLEAELRTRADRDGVFVLIGAALTAFLGLVAALGFRRWRRRVANVRPTPNRAQQSRSDEAAAQPKPVRDRSRVTQTPWGVPPSWSPSQARAGNNGMAPAGRLVPDEKTVAEVVGTASSFKSVFPGSGSGFRSKTANEIIRISFGTLSGAATPKDDD